MRDRLPERMDNAERPITVPQRAGDHAHRGQVVDLVELLLLVVHLLVDAVEVFRATGDLRLDLHLRKLGLQQVNGVVDIARPLLPLLGDQRGQVAVGLGVEVA